MDYGFSIIIQKTRDFSMGLPAQTIANWPIRARSFILLFDINMLITLCFNRQLEEATEMSARLGQNSLGKNLKMFALQNFGILFGFLIMFILAVYEEKISLEPGGDHHH